MGVGATLGPYAQTTKERICLTSLKSTASQKDAKPMQEHSRTLSPSPMLRSTTLDTDPEAITESAPNDSPELVGTR